MSNRMLYLFIFYFLFFQSWCSGRSQIKSHSDYPPDTQYSLFGLHYLHYLVYIANWAQGSWTEYYILSFRSCCSRKPWVLAFVQMLLWHKHQPSSAGKTCILAISGPFQNLSRWSFRFSSGLQIQMPIWLDLMASMGNNAKRDSILKPTGPKTSMASIPVSRHLENCLRCSSPRPWQARAVWDQMRICSILSRWL